MTKLEHAFIAIVSFVAFPQQEVRGGSCGYTPGFNLFYPLCQALSTCVHIRSQNLFTVYAVMEPINMCFEDVRA